VELALRRGKWGERSEESRVHAVIHASETRSITRPVASTNMEEAGAPAPPVPAPAWARAFIALPMSDARGVAMEVNGRTGIHHLVLCVFTSQPRDWRPRDIEALTIVGMAGAEEARLRAELAAQERIAEGLRRFSLRDPLTELANRELLLDRLGHATMRWARGAARDAAQAFALFSVSIDQFADIESTLGYEAADDVLLAVAQRFASGVRGVDTVARVGPDEFAILLEAVGDQNGALTVAQRIRDALRSPLTTRWGDSVMVSASIGIVMITSGVDSGPRLMQLAGTARARARSRGTGVEFFDARMQEQAQSRLRLETELRQAIEASEFELHYQPIVSLETGRIRQLEALVRWKRSGRGLVAPGDFIPLAEQTGVIVPLGWWVLAQACLQLSDWRRRLNVGHELTVGVNVAAPQLAQPDIVDRVATVLTASGLHAGAVHVEITESSMMRDAGTRATLERLRGLGVHVHLDDFGTGYSSLRDLHELPLDAIKIDRSFVAQLQSGSRNVSMVTTIRELARQIGVEVVAEGIESAEQLALVRSIGCDYAQGFFISEPLPAPQVDALLATAPVW
jgi:diguanylate cyclase (GGDEF)-like protein